MGVTGLWQIVDSVGHPIKLEGLEGKRLGVDANLWLYKFIRGFRDKDNGANLNAHKLGLFNRISKLLFYKIKPVFVFDGPAPILKRKTLEKRKNTRNNEYQKIQTQAGKLLAEQLKKQYPDADTDKITIKIPDLKSHNLVLAEKLTDEDRELFYLPPEEVKLETGEDDDDDFFSDDDDIFFEGSRPATSKVDIHSEDFQQLPAEIRYEHLTEIKDKNKRIRRAAGMPEDAESFSSFQLKRLRSRRNIQEKIEECEKDIQYNYTGEVRGQHVQSFRVQSDPTSTMLFGSVLSPRKPPLESQQQLDVKPKTQADPEDDNLRQEAFQPIKLTPNKIQPKTIRLDWRVSSGSHSPILGSPLLSSSSSSCSSSPAPGSPIQAPNQPLSDSTVQASPVLVSPLSDSSLSDSPELGSKDRPVQVDTSVEILQSVRKVRPVELESLPLLKAMPSSPEIITIDDSIRSEEASDVESLEPPPTPVKVQSQEETSIEPPEASVRDRATSPVLINETTSNLSTQTSVILTQTTQISTTEPSVVKPSEGLTPIVVSEPSEPTANDLTQKPDPGPQAVPTQTVDWQLFSDTMPNRNTIRTANKVTTRIIEEAKELLTLFGVPYMDAAGEAEAQLALLEQLNLTEGTITDDSDVWLFGAQNVYRHFFSDDKYVSQYKMAEIEFHTRLNRTNLICLAMLVGSDYTDGIMNVGPVKAIEILNEFPGDGLEPLLKFKQWRDQYDGSKRGKIPGSKKRESFLKYKLPEDFPSRVIFDGYMKPVADESSEKFEWGMPDLDDLREYARRNFGWNDKKIDEKILPVLKRLNERKTQPTIDSFFSTHLRGRRK